MTTKVINNNEFDFYTDAWPVTVYIRNKTGSNPCKWPEIKLFGIDEIRDAHYALGEILRKYDLSGLSKHES